jgi:hypothetical protein
VDHEDAAGAGGGKHRGQGQARAAGVVAADAAALSRGPRREGPRRRVERI